MLALILMVNLSSTMPMSVETNSFIDKAVKELSTKEVKADYVPPRSDGLCPGTGQAPNSYGWCYDAPPQNPCASDPWNCNSGGGYDTGSTFPTDCSPNITYWVETGLPLCDGVEGLEPTPAPTPPPPLVCGSHQNKVGTDPNAYCVDKPKPVCPAGTTPIGYQPTGYCLKTENVTEYIKQQETKYVSSDLNVNAGALGSTGERKDGQFKQDFGAHSNGWYLNGQGESYASNHVQFTNIPDNGFVNSLSDSWSPQFLITQGKTKLYVPKDNQSNRGINEQLWEQNLSTFKGSSSTAEIVAYHVSDLETLKTIQESSEGLIDIFSKVSGTYKHASNVVSTTVDSAGINGYENMKLNKSGYYLISSKYTDLQKAKQEMATPDAETIKKHTYYSFIPVNLNFTTDLGYLPIYNNLMTQVNENLLTIGNKKSNHKLNNLRYQNYKSMKVPSGYNDTKGYTLIASTNGGLQLLDANLNSVTINSSAPSIKPSSVKVNDILQYNDGFYIATDAGVLYLDCETNTLASTPVTETINDLELQGNSLYLITDTHLYQYFIVEDKMVKSNNEYDLKSMYSNPTSKAGQVQIVGDLMTVSTKDEGSGSEVLILTK